MDFAALRQELETRRCLVVRREQAASSHGSRDQDGSAGAEARRQGKHSAVRRRLSDDVKVLQQAQQGDVLVVDTRGSWRAVVGELFSMEAQRRGLAGIVVDGAVRDTEKVRSFSIPVYSRSITPVKRRRRAG